MLTGVAPRTEAFFDELRGREFARLDEQGLAYLDYTGSALHGASQIRAHRHLLERGVLGNPHADHAASRASTEAIDGARRAVLRFLDGDPRDHVVCFTANTTAAIKLVAESYGFGPGVELILSADNHNSVNGIREYARRAGSPVRYLALDDELRLLGAEAAINRTGAGGGLLAFPAQSNFSGVRHPLSLVSRAKSRGLDVLVDVAAYAPSHAFSLRTCPADFVALSFYKLFGYPTGVGALVARRDALSRLERPWFAGGTVTYASVQLDSHELRPAAEGFEDGTPDFLGIAALEAGFRLLDEAGMPAIGEHVTSLTGRLLEGLAALRHPNGPPVVRVYGPQGFDRRGGTVAFNVLDQSGRPLPYQVVESRARDAGVALRGGCFCNPGAAEAAFGFDVTRMARCLEQIGPGFEVDRLAACLGPAAAVGAVRASAGLANNVTDVERAIAVVASFVEPGGSP